MRPKPYFLATIVLSAVGLQAQEAGRPPQERRPPATRVISRADVDVRRRALAALLHEQWEHHLRSHPEFASIIGDKRYNDKLSDFSQAAVDRNLEQAAAFLRRFEAIDTEGFPAQERLNQELMVRRLRLELEGARFKDWEMPVFQNAGIHLDAPQLVSQLSFETVKDYEDYLARLHQLPRAFDQTVAQMRNGMRDGLMPPAFLLPKVVQQCENLIAVRREDSPFAQPLAKFPATFSEADKVRLQEGILHAIAEEVVPAYRTFAAFIRNEYAAKGRAHAGLWSLPQGGERYAYQVKASTTTDLSPDQIHQIGLKEVRRIEGRLLDTARKLGFQDLKSFNASLQTNPAVHPKSRQEIVDLYARYTTQMNAKLPQLFGRLPKAGVVVMPVPRFREKEAPAAAYDQGTPDGSRPGHIMVNTGDFASRRTISIETSALHEGVPGHHMQFAIAQELSELPPFRQQGDYTAYLEGWALYAELLGEEAGFYQDPYSYYGHLQDEMLRAIRLVVDTGLHHKKWTREQAVSFFHAHSGIEEVVVQSETDRYISWAGQALGYKVGQLKILELRDEAKRQLGAKFDIRKFHDELLGAGALPLDVLDRRIKAWVAEQKH
ncbi:DUF885 domain-containing protein [Geothrix edaphica]|uniref:X-Pro dipeptidyl-peptidase n=1 Tax=Geothrix edaphica TaxID=2927976 RepID=A0ABQ5Q0Y3_9BACT|nr:DUF885 family protein [Geothrix edaphica]GLH68188.1 X-Pro dipeptidyl-peptidase [Geothrix edaphica]